MKARFALLARPKINTVGLVGHWKLWDGSAFDYSLRGHTGVLTGTTLTYRYPGLDLEGADEHIVVTDHADFSPILTPFSISAWVYMHDNTNFIIISKGVVTVDGEWELSCDAGKLSMIMYDNSIFGGYIQRYYNTAISINIWHHIMMIYDGGTLPTSIKLYINGVQVDDTSRSSGTFEEVENLAHAVWIGRYDNLYSNGLIDDLMIFNVEKSAAEVKSIYEVTRRRYGV